MNRFERLSLSLVMMIFICITSSCDEPISIETVQSQLDRGKTPIDIYNDGIPVDSLYGKTYNEGLIFYLDIINGTGLLAAFDDIDECNWGPISDNPNLNNVTSLGVLNCRDAPLINTIEGARIGDGILNTDAMLDFSSNAIFAGAKCRELGADWFLPSVSELNLMYANLHLNGHGDFSPSRGYWTSNERDDEVAWFKSFFPDSDGCTILEMKYSARFARAAKGF